MVDAMVDLAKGCLPEHTDAPGGAALRAEARP